jgi:hypothetical protein
VTRAEARWLAVVALATLLLVEIPYVLAYAQAARAFTFAGMIWSPQDFSQYAAAMREGASTSSWLIHDHLTSERHAPTFMYPLYVGLGKLAHLLGLDLQIAYRMAELAARAVLLIAIYRFCGTVFTRVSERRLAFALIVFSSGLAFWTLMLEVALPGSGLRELPLTPELSRPEVSTFLVLFTAPHLMLGLALLLLAGGAYLNSWSRPGLHPTVVTVGATFGLAMTNPFGLIALGAVLASHLTLTRLRGVRPPRSSVLSAAGALVIAVPFLLQNLLVFGTDPFWGVVYGQQNVIPSPPAPLLAMGFAPVLVLAAFGLPAFLRGMAPERSFVVVWMLLGLALICVPSVVGFQRRFVFGVQPMLALVATVGLQQVLQWGGSPWRAFGLRVACRLATVSVFISTACIYGAMLLVVAHPAAAASQGGTFHPLALKDAGRWLATVMESHDVVLAATATGNYLAGETPGRVFIGHPIATLSYEEKVVTMRSFYRDEDPEHRRRFLVANNVRFVVYGPHERTLGAAPPSDDRHLRPVYEADGVSIYERTGMDRTASFDVHGKLVSPP